MKNKWVYLFREGNGSMKDLLGGKGANLAEMTRVGLPVPPGFTITTEVCNEYLRRKNKLSREVLDQVTKSLKTLESQTRKKFGSSKNPLLVSVRSGAKFSMPGMMDTVLNLGLNDQTVEGLFAMSQDERFAFDAYRRFLQMFGNVVLYIDKDRFEERLEALKKKKGYQEDTELVAAEWRQIVKEFQEVIKKETGQGFPQDPMEQLRLAIEAVFNSWNIPRAVAYRNYNKIAHDLGTAVNVQAMVFGNLGDDSATGVAFTRNPSTGEDKIFGEYLTNAQGEDVVAGIRTPKSIGHLKKEMSGIYQEFARIADKLEKHYQDVQDLEFTVEKGKLYMLQTRNGKRTARAAVKIAVDLAQEKIVTKKEALMLVDPSQLTQLLIKSFDPKAKQKTMDSGEFLASGLGASPGAAIGRIVFSPQEAEKRANAGEKIILVRPETCPDDIAGMIPSQGVLTSRGGMTSHAAVVARGMGKPCVAGCEAVKVDLARETLTVAGRDGDEKKVFRKNDYLSIDGTTGEVFAGQIETIDPRPDKNFQTLLQWADEVRHLKVRANADTPKDAAKAVELGAEGIGLCRTEHMFMQKERLGIVREMILAATKRERKEALDKLLPFQREDFKGIFKAMASKPVTIRLLDPPLHEFLPDMQELACEVAVLAAQKNKLTKKQKQRLEAKESLLKKVANMHEANPMMGLRGCRLGLMYPGINKMQVRAILEAAADLKKKGQNVEPEIMIPLISHVNELKTVKAELEKVAKETLQEKGVKLNYMFGTMIEIPRAALTANEIAEHAQFFSFGTNDLTQMTYGLSRDDAEAKFLGKYLEKKILEDNPFESLDQAGVGQLVKIAIKKGRRVRGRLKLGVCGEHGGDPRSIEFFHKVGLNYVSCSPFRVPVARLAAAQAKLAESAE